MLGDGLGCNSAIIHHPGSIWLIIQQAVAIQGNAFSGGLWRKYINSLYAYLMMFRELLYAHQLVWFKG